MSPGFTMPVTLRHPEPPPVAPFPLRPVFLPFAGCPQRCVYCAQDVQTGMRDSAPAPEALRHEIIGESRNRSGPVELAFYGGTFTALPRDRMEAYLAVAAGLREAGHVARVRCSTRPDCLDPGILDLLARGGVDLVELGVQSFDAAVLAAAGRGYDAATARRGCQAVRDAGLELGIQLLPGLPGMTREIFERDVASAAALEPRIARLYPLLVLEGTPLAAQWRAGEHVPWSLEETVDALADAYLALWRAGIRVIRAGLAPEASLDAAYLAGPNHPALGQRARSLTLFRLLKPALAMRPGPVRIDYPRRFQGELWGHRGELVSAYAALGLAQNASIPHGPPWEEGRFVVTALDTQR